MLFKGIITICLFACTALAQNQNWRIFNTSNSGLPGDYILYLAKESNDAIWIGGEFSNVTRFDGENWSVWNREAGEIISLAVDDQNNLWIGSDNGPLTKFDGINFNEFLPGRNARHIAVDNNDDIWVGSFQGLSKFDGLTLTHYDTSNSGLPYAHVFANAADRHGIVWAAGRNRDNIPGHRGLIRFDGKNWTAFGDYFPVWSQSIAIDDDDNIWIGTGQEGLLQFDRSKWTAYPAPDSNLYFLGAIAIDTEKNKWCGFDGGLAKFDGDNWEVYTVENSPLPGQWVTAIVIDSVGNKWVGTYGGGLAVFNENGVVTNVENVGPAEAPKQFILRQNYPNPFNSSTIISYELESSTRVLIRVYNLAGQQVKILVNENQVPGSHSVVWQGDDEKGISVSSSLYMYRLESDNNFEMRKMLLLR